MKKSYNFQRGFVFLLTLAMFAFSGQIFAQYSFAIPSAATTNVYSGHNVISCYSKANNWICANGYLNINGGCGGANYPYPQQGIFFVEPGGTIDLRGAGGSYTAYLKAGATYIGGGGGSNIIYADPSCTISNPGTTVIYGTVNFDYTNAPVAGCTPIPTITGPLAMCTGTATNYTTETGMSSYSWTITGSGNVINSGANTSTANVTWATSGTLSVSYTSGSTPSAVTTKNISATTCGPITATASTTNATNTCNTSDGSLTITASGGNGANSYYYSVSGPQSANAYGSSPYTLTGLLPGSYSVSVQDAVSVGTQTLDQYQNNFYNQEGPLNGYWGTQSFTVGKSGQLSQIDIGFSTGPGYNNNVSGTGTLKIFSGTGIGGTLLSTQTISFSNTNPASSTVYMDTVRLTSPLAVTSGQTYTFQVIPTSVTGSLWMATGNPYSGQCTFYGSGFGYQWVFKTYVSDPPVPDGYLGTTTATVGGNLSCGPIAATVTQTSTTNNCGSNDGKLTINVTGGGDGRNSYYFSISGPQTASVYGPSGTTISGLQPGNYTVSVADAYSVGVPTVDQSQPNFYTWIYAYGTSPGAVQSFKAGQTGTLTEIDMGFASFYGTGSGTLNVFSGSGTGGTQLLTQSVSVTGSGSFLAPFLLSTPVAVTSGQTYTFQFIPGTGFSYYWLYLQAAYTGQYPNGNLFTTSYGGYSSNSGYELVFKTYVTSTPIPDNSQSVFTKTVTPANTCGKITASGVGHNATNNCDISDGYMTITANGGNFLNSYYYFVSGPGNATATGPSGTNIYGLPSGTYTVKIFDANSTNGADGDSTSITVVVGYNNACTQIQPSATSTNTTTDCSSDGVVTVYATDGDSRFFYYYTISGPNGYSSATYGYPYGYFNNLRIGNYTITAYDGYNTGDGQSNTTSVDVFSNSTDCGSPISITSLASNTNSTHACSADGTIDISVTGGDNTGNYFYVVSGPTSSSFPAGSSTTIYNLLPGSYSIAVYDYSSQDNSDGNATSGGVDVNSNTSICYTYISASPTPGDETCSGYNGYIDMGSVSGGDQSNYYYYSIYNNYTGYSNSAYAYGSTIFYSLQNGYYTVQVYDANNTSDGYSFTTYVTINNNTNNCGSTIYSYVSSSSNSSNDCSSDGSFYIYASGGDNSNNYSYAGYNYSNGSTYYGSGSNYGTLGGLPPGSYNITVSDASNSGDGWATTISGSIGSNGGCYSSCSCGNPGNYSTCLDNNNNQTNYNDYNNSSWCIPGCSCNNQGNYNPCTDNYGNTTNYNDYSNNTSFCTPSYCSCGNYGNYNSCLDNNGYGTNYNDYAYSSWCNSTPSCSCGNPGNYNSCLDNNGSQTNYNDYNNSSWCHTTNPIYSYVYTYSNASNPCSSDGSIGLYVQGGDGNNYYDVDMYNANTGSWNTFGPFSGNYASISVPAGYYYYMNVYDYYGGSGDGNQYSFSPYTYISYNSGSCPNPIYAYVYTSSNASNPCSSDGTVGLYVQGGDGNNYYDVDMYNANTGSWNTFGPFSGNYASISVPYGYYYYMNVYDYYGGSGDGNAYSFSPYTYISYNSGTCSSPIYAYVNSYGNASNPCSSDGYVQLYVTGGDGNNYYNVDMYNANTGSTTTFGPFSGTYANVSVPYGYYYYMTVYDYYGGYYDGNVYSFSPFVNVSYNSGSCPNPIYAYVNSSSYANDPCSNGDIQLYVTGGDGNNFYLVDMYNGNTGSWSTFGPFNGTYADVSVPIGYYYYMNIYDYYGGSGDGNAYSWSPYTYISYNNSTCSNNGCTGSFGENGVYGPPVPYIWGGYAPACVGGQPAYGLYPSNYPTIYSNAYPGNYTYQWSSSDNGASIPEATSWSTSVDWTQAGTQYAYVTVTDGNGCSASGSLQVDVAPSCNGSGSQISANLGFNNETCPGSSDGSISISASGGDGTNNYYAVAYLYGSTTYTANSNGSSNFSITGLPSGQYYYVYVYDASNTGDGYASYQSPFASIGDNYGYCSSYISAYIYSANNSTTDCSNDGSITVNATGGDGNNYYTMDVYQNGNYYTNINGGYGNNYLTVSGLAPASYSFNIYDANNTGDGYGTSASTSINSNGPCSSTISASIYANSASSTDCSNNGEVTIYATGGDNANYYSVDAYLEGNFYSTFTGSYGNNYIDMPNLAPGSYSFNVNDANNTADGLGTSTSAYVSSYGPCVGQITVSIDGSQDNTNCFTPFNGVINASASGGNGNYSYIISPDPNLVETQTSGLFTNLPAGDYNIIASDGYNTPGSNSVTINDASSGCPTPIYSMSSTYGYALSACSSDGYIDVEATGGDNSGYYYSLDGGTPQPSNHFDGLTPTSHTMTIYDADYYPTFTNDPFSFEFQFTTPSTFGYCLTPITAVTTIHNATSSCTNDGGVTIESISGGTDIVNNYYEIDIDGQAWGYFQASQLPITFGAFLPGVDHHYVLINPNDPTNIGNDWLDLGIINFTTTWTCQVQITPTETDASCISVNDGTVTISATGGDHSNYYYFNLYNNSTGYNVEAYGNVSNTFTGVPAGAYDIFVGDGSSVNDGNSNSSSIIVNSGNCPGGNTWQGTYSNDFSDGRNWSSGNAPASCSDNVTIPENAVTDPMISGPVQVGDVIFTGSGTETLDVEGDLSVCGTWSTGNGLAVTVSGTKSVIFDGTVAQTISGNNDFNIVHVNNAAGVSLAIGATVDIIDALELESGDFDASLGTLTFKSTAQDKGGILDNFSYGNPGTLRGNATAERFYGPAALFAQHMLGTPVSGITLGTMGSTQQAGAFITPTSDCDELHSASGTAYNNVFSYHENHGSSCTMAEWYVEPAGIAPTNGQGYSVVLTHPNTAFALTGNVNQNQSYSISGLGNSQWGNTSKQGRSFISGWSLMSNPYLAPLDAAGLITDNSGGFDLGILVWNNTTGSYQSATTIAPFQAFLVHRKTSLAGSSTYTINGNRRTRSSFIFQKTQNPNELNLTATNKATGLTDETMVGFKTDATDKFDEAYDFYKMPNALSRHTLYTMNDNKWMLRNTLANDGQTATVAVGFEPGVSGTYTFNFGGIGSFDPTSYVTLEDKQLNQFYDVRQGDYTFSSSESDNWNRFVLHFTPAAQINTTDATCSNTGMINIAQPGTADWSYTVTDNQNTTLWDGILNANNPLTVNATAGNYLLTLKDHNGYTVVKNITVNGVQMADASFSSSTTTAEENQEVTLSSTATSNTNSTTSYTWNFGDGSTGTGATVSHRFTGEGVYNVTLSVQSQGGCVAQSAQDISVTRSATGIQNVGGNEGITIWSSDNQVNVDFTKVKGVQAHVDIYNLLGQQISSDKYTTNTVYTKQIPNIEVGYVVVKVINNEAITTKKVLISNVAK